MKFLADLSKEEFDKEVELFCKEKDVVKPEKNADLKIIFSWASHFATWYGQKVSE